MKIIVMCLCVFAFLFLYHSFNEGINFVNNQYVPADYVVISGQIRSEVKDKLSKRYNMRLIGVTGGMADCVNVLGLDFQIQGPLSKEELRKMLIDCVEEFLAPINANERLRPFLKNYPFTPNEIEIKIFVVDSFGGRLYDPEISVAAAAHGRLRYCTNERGKEFGYKTRVEEDYETALQIVKESKK